MTESQSKREILDVVSLLLLVAPWLNPVSMGPTPTVMQWLVAWTAAAVWLLMGYRRAVRLPLTQSASLTWIAAATISALMGLIQYSGLTAHFYGLISDGESGQAYANLRQRNQLATLLSIGLATLLLTVHAGVGLLPFTGRKFTLLFCGLVIVTAISATGSRTGLIQLMLVCAMFIWWRRELSLVVGVTAVYVLAAFVLPHALGLEPFASGILGRVGEDVARCGSRTILWTNVLHLIAQKPWMGWGWGELSYAHFITLYPGERFCDILDNAHNLPLHLAVTLGVPMSIAVCAAMTYGVARAKPWRETVPARQMAWAVLAVIALHSLLEYPLWYSPFQLAVVFCMGLLWWVPKSLSTKSDAGGWQGSAAPLPLVGLASLTPLARKTVASIAIILVATCGLVGWDYWRISQIYLPLESRAAAYRDDTLQKIKSTWLFQNQVQFAELNITPLGRDNALLTYTLALGLLHFSPEPRVIEKLIESAVMLGRDVEALYYLKRYKAAFPGAHALWSQPQSPTQ